MQHCSFRGLFRLQLARSLAVPRQHQHVSASTSSMCAPRRYISMPRVEQLTSRRPPVVTDAYISVSEGVSGEDGEEGTELRGAKPKFAVKDSERGLYDRGVSSEAKDYIAEAEEEYRASSAFLHNVPGGPGLPEAETRIDEVTGEVLHVQRISAPVGETYVPSHKERHALRGDVGQLSYEQETGKIYQLDEHAQLNLRKERQLEELMASPMPALGKVKEASLALQDFYSQSLALQPRTAEIIMMLFSQVSLQLRMEGKSASSALLLDEHKASQQQQLSYDASVPLLSEMRQLYSHQKKMFVAPTPLTIENFMVSISAYGEPSKELFHLASRLLLDCDKYVVLPTRSSYAAYFTICSTNDSMQFAVARLKDAVQELHVSIDAGMAVALLKGFTESGRVEEALALLARLEKVPMTIPLLNASLEALLLSQQPLACFSVFDAVRPASLKPNADTYTLLLLACEQSGQWGRVTAVLADMQKRRVKGNAQCLNLMLKGLLSERLYQYASQLHATMRKNDVEVWPALEKGLRKLSTGAGASMTTTNKHYD